MNQTEKETLQFKLQIYEAIRIKYSKDFPNLIPSQKEGFDYERDVPEKIKILVLTQGLKNLGTFHQSTTRKVLQLLWEAYQKGYYHGEDEQYDTFKEWVDKEIVPFFGDTSYSYLNAQRLTIERAISYIHKRDMEQNSITDDQGNRITVNDILSTANTSQFDNLNRAGPRLTDDDNENEEIIKDALTQKPKEFRDGIKTKITIKLRAYRHRQNGITTLIIPNISEDEMVFLLNAYDGLLDIQEQLPEGLTIETEA